MELSSKECSIVGIFRSDQSQEEFAQKINFLKLGVQNGTVISDLFQEHELLNNTTLLEYIVSKGDSWIKVREDFVILLKIIIERDVTDPVKSQKRLKLMIKENLNTSPGLVACMKSVNEKYVWSKSKARVSQFKDFFLNIIFGWGLWILDVATDVLFTKGLLEEYNLNANVTNNVTDNNVTTSDNLEYSKNEENENLLLIIYLSVAHIILPWIISLIVFFVMIFPDTEYSGSWKEKMFQTVQSLGKFPLPLCTKPKKYVLCHQLHELRTRESLEKEKVVKKMKELQDQNAFINLSAIIEGTFESSFQLWFQTLYFFPVLVLFNSKPLVTRNTWIKILSILSSFITTAYSIVYSR